MDGFQRAWDGLFSPKTSPQHSPKLGPTSQPPVQISPDRPRWIDRPEERSSSPEYGAPRYAYPRPREDLRPYPFEGRSLEPVRQPADYYALPRGRSETASPYRRRPGVEYLEPRYVEGRQVEYDPRYDLYQADRRSEPAERRVVEPHEMRILGEKVASQTNEYASPQRISVPTSRSDYRTVDRERVPTPQRVRQSQTSGQPRSNSPLAVRQHDHTLYSSPSVQVDRSPPRQMVRATAPPSPPQVIEKIVNRIVEVPVEKIVEKVVTVEVPVEKVRCSKACANLFHLHALKLMSEQIVDRPVIEYRDRVVEKEKVETVSYTTCALSSRSGR